MRSTSTHADSPQTAPPADLPKVSVLVITYNEEDHLRKTIESLKKIEYPRELLEFILVDSRSTDNTVSIAKEFFDVVLLTEGEYRSPGRGEATGLAAATGDYVSISSGDSIVDPQWIMAAVRGFQEDPRENLVAVTGLIEERHEEKQSFIKSLYTVSFASRLPGDIPYATGGMYRMSLVRKHGLQMEDSIRMEEETSMGISAYAAGLVIKRIDAPFLLHESGYSNSFDDVKHQLSIHLRVAECRAWLWVRYKEDKKKRALLFQHMKASVQRGFIIDALLVLFFVALATLPWLAGGMVGLSAVFVVALGLRFSKVYSIPLGHAIGYVLYKFILTYWVLAHAFVFYLVKTKVSTRYGYPRPV